MITVIFIDVNITTFTHEKHKLRSAIQYSQFGLGQWKKNNESIIKK